VRAGNDQRRRRLLRWGLPLAVVAGVGAYYRYRPLPPGINAMPRSYRLPAESIRFFHNTAWYEQERRHFVREIVPEVIRIIRGARKLVVMDVFLFSLHHADRSDDYLPTTRQVVEAFREHDRPAWFITDPINTTYGSWISPPLRWLEEAGVTVCVTDLRKLRDNNMLYSPLWRLALQWFGTSGPPRINNPLEPDATTTPWALLEGINARGNHRKLLIADDGDDYVTHVTSSNLEDAGSYFSDTGVTIYSSAVASHYLEAERAVARMSGVEIPARIPAREGSGDTVVTPLMGEHIKQAIVRELDAASPRDRLYLFAQFLSERGTIEALVRASRRGVRGTLVLDQSKIDFGAPKSGFPNQVTAPELARRTAFELRWANTRHQEYHNQFLLFEKPGRCVFFAGSANYNRRSLLGDSVLEANARIDAPHDADISRQVLDYAHWMTEAPRSLPYEQGPRQDSLPKYALYRLLDATGSGTF
jgi:hypothetical protein